MREKHFGAPSLSNHGNATGLRGAGLGRARLVFPHGSGGGNGSGQAEAKRAEDESVNALYKSIGPAHIQAGPKLHLAGRLLGRRSCRHRLLTLEVFAPSSYASADG